MPDSKVGMCLECDGDCVESLAFMNAYQRVLPSFKLTSGLSLKTGRNHVLWSYEKFFQPKRHLLSNKRECEALTVSIEQFCSAAPLCHRD